MLTPVDEVEGNPFLSITFPLSEQLALEFLTRISVQEFREKQPDVTFLTLPIIPKFSLNAKNLDLFLFSMMQFDFNQVFWLTFPVILGVNAGYSTTLGDEITVSFYFEGTLKTQSEREKVILNQDDEFGYHTDGLSDPVFVAFLGGIRTRLSTPTVGFLDAFELAFEFYYDGENWSKYEYGNYLNALDNVRNREYELDHFEALSLFETFRNSKTYLYVEFFIKSLFLTDFEPGFQLIVSLPEVLDDFINMTAYSYVCVPQVSYPFKDTNFTAGIMVPMFIGGGETNQGHQALPPVDERTEFGTDFSRIGFQIYLDITL